jgi:hypothetical protein
MRRIIFVGSADRKYFFPCSSKKNQSFARFGPRASRNTSCEPAASAAAFWSSRSEIPRMTQPWTGALTCTPSRSLHRHRVAVLRAQELGCRSPFVGDDLFAGRDRLDQYAQVASKKFQRVVGGEWHKLAASGKRAANYFKAEASSASCARLSRVGAFSEIPPIAPAVITRTPS